MNASITSTVKWDVNFKRKEEASYVIPGFHSQYESLIGQNVFTVNKIRALITNVQHHVPWKKLTMAERKQIKTRYGKNAQQDFHQFTRIVLERWRMKHPMFPAIDWEE